MDILFKKLIQKMLGREGKYQNWASDKGNYNSYNSSGRFIGWGEGVGPVGTMWGISAAALSARYRREVSAEQMKNLSKEEAIEIYYHDYWRASGAYKIKNEHLAELVFDAVVNMKYWTKVLQQSLNYDMGTNLAVDNVCGPKTRAALAVAASTNPWKLYESYRAGRIAWYYHEGQTKFKKGWLNRMEDFPTLAEIMKDMLQEQEPEIRKKRGGIRGTAMNGKMFLSVNRKGVFRISREAVKVLKLTAGVKLKIYYNELLNRYFIREASPDEKGIVISKTGTDSLGFYNTPLSIGITKRYGKGAGDKTIRYYIHPHAINLAGKTGYKLKRLDEK